MAIQQRHAQPGNHRFLDRLVAAELHADHGLHAVPRKHLVACEQCARARFAHQERFAGESLEGAMLVQQRAGGLPAPVQRAGLAVLGAQSLRRRPAGW